MKRINVKIVFHWDLRAQSWPLILKIEEVFNTMAMMLSNIRSMLVSSGRLCLRALYSFLEFWLVKWQYGSKAHIEWGSIASDLWDAGAMKYNCCAKIDIFLCFESSGSLFPDQGRSYRQRLWGWKWCFHGHKVSWKVRGGQADRGNVFRSALRRIWVHKQSCCREDGPATSERYHERSRGQEITWKFWHECCV